MRGKLGCRESKVHIVKARFVRVDAKNDEAVYLKLTFPYQTFTAGIAVINRSGYLDWQQISLQESATSRYVPYPINNFLSHY